MNKHHEISGVPVIKQYPVLPTGCEATALTMLLQWAGVPVEKEAVADSLVKEPNPHEVEGRTVGGNPNRAFVGDPYDADSFGVFHEPLAAALEHFLPGRAKDLSGCAFSEVLREIDAGHPVVVWATIELKEPRYTQSWEDVHDRERIIRWQSPQHAMLLVGYEADAAVIAHDPHTGQREVYDRALFEQRFEQLGRQAVTVTEKTLA